MTQISTKQQNWLVAVLFIILVVFVDIPIVNSIANGFKSEFKNTFSNADWWASFCVFFLLFGLLMAGFSYLLIDWLGPEILLSERIEQAQKRVSECERELDIATHELNEISKNAND